MNELIILLLLNNRLLDYNTLFTIIKCNKKINNNTLLKKKIKNIYLEKVFNKIKNCNIDKFFENSFIPVNLLHKIPVLKFQDKFLGCTEYIDNIRYNDMQYPIMKGVDIYERPFICIKYKIKLNKIKLTNETINFDSHEGVITIFQRYSLGNSWVKSCKRKCPIIYGSQISLDKIYKKIFIINICEILKNDDISIYCSNEKKKYSIKLN